jgi:hypothetical protein
MESIAAYSDTSKSPYYHSSNKSTASSCGGSKSRIRTPLLSVCDEIPIDLEICSQKPLNLDYNDFVVIDTTKDGGIHQSDSVASLDSRGLSINCETTVTFLITRVDAIHLDGSVDIIAGTAIECA